MSSGCEDGRKMVVMMDMVNGKEKDPVGLEVGGGMHGMGCIHCC